MTIVIEQSDTIQRASVTNGGRTANTALRGGTASPTVMAWAQAQGEVVPLVDELKPEAFQRRLAESVQKHVVPAWKAEQARLQSAKRQHVARMNRLTAGDGLDAAQAVADRSAFLALDGIANQRRWIASASRDMLAAVFGNERSRFPAADDATWQAGLDRLARLTFIEQAGVQAMFPARATATEVAPIGVDTEAVAAHAEQAFAAFAAEIAATKHAERALRDNLDMLAVAMDLPTAAAALALVEAA